jgi:hypothetical protein
LKTALSNDHFSNATQKNLARWVIPQCDTEATMTQLSQRLIDGLRQLHSIYPNLPLVPLNDNKQPLGDGWQNRPFTATELIFCLEKGGVEVPIQGKIKKIQPQGYGILTGRPLTINGITYYLMALDLDGASAAALQNLAKLI